MRSLRRAALFALPLFLIACGSESGPGGTSDTGAVDTGADSAGDTGEPDSGNTDVGGEDTDDDAPVLDTDNEVEQDVFTGGLIGEDCEIDEDCESQRCIRVDAALETGFCSAICTANSDCPEDWACVTLVDSGVDAQQLCVPVDLCIDADVDGYGVGPGCAGPDCDDNDPNTNPAAEESCDSRDNDCDEMIDENPSKPAKTARPASPACARPVEPRANPG